MLFVLQVDSSLTLNKAKGGDTIIRDDVLQSLKDAIRQIKGGDGPLNSRKYSLNIDLPLDEIMEFDSFVVECYFTILHLSDTGHGASTEAEIDYFYECFFCGREYSPDDFSSYLKARYAKN